MKKKAIVQIGSSKRAHSVPAEYREESMPPAGAFGDHEPPTPPPPLPPPFENPESTVFRIAQYMAQAKSAKKKLQVTPDEALDRLLAKHDRKAAKKKKQVTPDEAMDMLLAEHDRKAGKVAKKAGGQTTLAIQDDILNAEETQLTGALVSKKAKIVQQPDMKPSKKAKKSAAGASGSQRRMRYAT